jgi:hypothetical protein
VVKAVIELPNCHRQCTISFDAIKRIVFWKTQCMYCPYAIALTAVFDEADQWLNSAD